MKSRLCVVTYVHISVNIFRRTKTVIVYACLMLYLLLPMRLCQFSRCPCKGMQQKCFKTGSWLICLSLKNLIYCPLAICNFQFAALFLHHSTIVDFSSFASPSTLSSQCVSLTAAVGELNSAESLKEDGWRD